MGVWCKICGITRAQDARDAFDAGADAIGLNFFPDSSRYVSPSEAATIAAQVDGEKVAVFVDAQRSEIEAVIEQVGVNLLQFHGTESPEFCTEFDLPYMKVLRVSPELNLITEIERYSDAKMILLDTYIDGQQGGTGRTFDWALWPQHTDAKLVLAGGLHAQNVAHAISTVKPFGVDVAGGVESEVPGKKDRKRILNFVSEVRRVE